MIEEDSTIQNQRNLERNERTREDKEL